MAQLLASLVEGARGTCERVLLVLLLVLEVEIHAVRGDVEDLLRVHLLLLMQRDLVIELLQQLLRVRENVILIVVLLIVCPVLSVLLLEAGVYHGLILRKGSQLMIVVVAIELRLHRVPPQILRPLDEVGVLQVLPLFIDVLLIVVIVRRWYEWRSQLLLVEILPRKIRKPWMILDFVTATVAQSILRLSLDHFVDEVGGLDPPADRYFLLLNMDLLRENVVPDVLPRLAHVRPLPEHALVGEDADGEVVDGVRVILPAHYFRRHVPRRAGSVLRVLLPPVASDAEVGDAQVALVVDNEVLRLDITMYDLLFVAVLEAGDKTRHKET